MRKLLFLCLTLLLAMGMSVAQTDQGNQGGSASGQGNDAGVSAGAQAGDQGASAGAQVGDQGASAGAQAGDQNQAAGADQGALPQTASPLPLIALLGMGSLAVGLIRARRR